VGDISLPVSGLKQQHSIVSETLPLLQCIWLAVPTEILQMQK